MALVLITHDMGVVAETAQRVVVQYAGQQVEAQQVRGPVRRPAPPLHRGPAAALPERASGAALPTIPGVVPGAGDRPSGCLFNPRCALRAPSAASRSSRRSQPGPRGKVRCHYPLTDGRPANHPRYAEAAA